MAEEKKKSRVDDINRSVYDIKDEVEFSYKADRGLTEDIIRKISAEKEEPAWMLFVVAIVQWLMTQLQA